MKRIFTLCVALLAIMMILTSCGLVDAIDEWADEKAEHDIDAAFDLLEELQQNQ